MNVHNLKVKLFKLKESICDAFHLFHLGLFEARSAKNFRLPDFICIGAQKAGTTWLMNNLKNHPDIYLPDVPPHYDIHFFDLHLKKGLGYYTDFFKLANKRLTGENTPAYGIMHPRKIKLVKKLMPDLKILFMVRDQKERALSHAKMNLAKKYDPIPDNELIHHFNIKRSRLRGDYLRILNNWTKYYSRKQILVIDYERIKENPREIIEEIFIFLNLSVAIDWDQIPFEEKFNMNPKMIVADSVIQELARIYPLSHKEMLREIDLVLNENRNQ